MSLVPCIKEGGGPSIKTSPRQYVKATFVFTEETVEVGQFKTAECFVPEVGYLPEVLTITAWGVNGTEKTSLGTFTTDVLVSVTGYKSLLFTTTTPSRYVAVSLS